jgi:RNA polymerase sigma-70 factor (ECF subfamily)
MKELQQQVNKLIGNLPEKCQLIFKMSRNEGLSSREIADQLNLSHRTIETQISKAIKTLRQALKNINALLF